VGARQHRPPVARGNVLRSVPRLEWHEYEASSGQPSLHTASTKTTRGLQPGQMRSRRADVDGPKRSVGFDQPRHSKLGRRAPLMAPWRGFISLDRLHCHRAGETFGAEPYLLTAFFKIDGDTNSIVVRGGDFGIGGPCTFHATPGSHGNLRDTDVHDGDDVLVPPAIGEFDFALEPILATEELNLMGSSTAGAVGVILALIEENSMSDAGAAAGHAAFDRTLRREIDDTIIPELRQGGGDPLPPELKAEITDAVFQRFHAAVVDKQGFFRNFISFFNGDLAIGSDAFFANRSREIHARLRRFTLISPSPTSPPQPVLAQDYELYGSIVVDVPLQLMAVAGDGGLWHAIRDTNGAWDGFGDVKGQTGPDRGAFTSVGCAGIGHELHVVGTTSDGGIWRTLRHPRVWDSFEDVKSQAGTHPGRFSAVDCAIVGEGDLHIGGTTSDGNLWHAIHHANGHWDGFGDVKNQTGPDRGAFTSVGCAGIGEDLHLVGTTSDGNLWHAIRHPGFWDGFGDVKSQTGPDRGAFASVRCAGIGEDLHLVGTTSDGNLWHAIRHPGFWDGFGDVKSQAGNPGGFTAVGCAAFGGDLHVCATTSDGGIWRTIRHANGAWDGFEDVKSQAGTHPGRLAAAACANA
jgi:hypothetical protein